VAIVDERYVTVEQAATLLGMSTSTVWRWINRGDLPAYRLGRRRVLIKRDDLDRMIGPARAGKRSVLGHADQEILAPLTEEEKRQRLNAIEWLRSFQNELLRRRGGELFPDSAEELNEIRDQRTRELP
jgi:excisionase family DNA binding protein